MNPQQLRHTYMQCGAETDRRAQPAHRTEYLFRQQVAAGKCGALAGTDIVSRGQLAFQICNSGSSGRLGGDHATVGISVSRLEVWRSTTALPHTLIYRGPAV